MQPSADHSSEPADESFRQEPLMRRFTPKAIVGDPDDIPVDAFRPTASDLTGISVSLRRLPHPIRRVLADTRKPAESYSVCEFDLQGLVELTLLPSPTESDPGHATIPQIAPPYDDLKKTDARKIQLKEWQLALQQRSRIIHRAGDAIE